MRILCVAAYRSNHADRHLSLLARAGCEVHLAALDGAWLARGGLADEVRIHQRPIAGETAPLPFPRVASSAHAELVADQRYLLALADRALPSKGADDAATWLAGLIDALRPDVLHSFALHQASFLTLVARNRCKRPLPPWIVSNWGCDIQHFGHHPALRHDYRPAIVATLQAALGYFAESRRDDRLARDLGFRGTTLAVAPIGGGFDLDWYRALRSGAPPSQRPAVMVKGYQGDGSGLTVGHAVTALDALRLAGDCVRRYEINLYAISARSVPAAETLRDRHGLTVRIHSFMPYDALMRLHGRARCSIAISETDGLCTTAVEALLMGSMPVQSDTSCLDEWTEPGNVLFVPHDDPAAIADAIRRALTDDAFVDAAARINDATLQSRFAMDVINPGIVAMYHQIAASPGEMRTETPGAQACES